MRKRARTHSCPKFAGDLRCREREQTGGTLGPRKDLRFGLGASDTYLWARIFSQEISYISHNRRNKCHSSRIRKGCAQNLTFVILSGCRLGILRPADFASLRMTSLIVFYRSNESEKCRPGAKRKQRSAALCPPTPAAS